MILYLLNQSSVWFPQRVQKQKYETRLLLPLDCALEPGSLGAHQHQGHIPEN